MSLTLMVPSKSQKINTFIQPLSHPFLSPSPFLAVQVSSSFPLFQYSITPIFHWAKEAP